MSAGKYREKIYRQVHENVASLNDYSLRIVGMSDLGLTSATAEVEVLMLVMSGSSMAQKI